MSAVPVILALDFDGVTHPDPCFAQSKLCQLHLIEAVLREFTHVQILISSSWRDYYSLSELREMFSKDIQTRVVGVTPSIKTPSPLWSSQTAPTHERQWEIETWLKANRPCGTPWMAIDDRPHWFVENCVNLLVTQSAFGFQPDQQPVLRSMLNHLEQHHAP